MADQWYYTQNDERQGPVTPEQLKQLAIAGQLNSDDLVWTKGMKDWQPASQVEGLIPSSDVPPPIFNEQPPPLTQQPPFVPSGNSPSPSTAGTSAQRTPSISQVGATLQQGLGAIWGRAKGVAQQFQAKDQPISPPSLTVALTQPVGTAPAMVTTGTLDVPGLADEAAVVYIGGHPEHIDSTEGCLRLTEAGIEFPSTSMLIPYEGVLDMSVIKGKLPNSYIQMLNAKAQQGKWVGFAAKVGASHFLGSKSASLVEQGVGKAVTGDGAPVQAPTNRICVLVKLEGVKYKVLFDALGNTPEAMEQSAQRFCNLSVRVRSRFGRSAALPASQPSDDGSAVVTVASTCDAEVPPTVVKKVVGCPKCKAKVRTSKPGIITCPKCQAKIRVGENLFQN